MNLARQQERRQELQPETLRNTSGAHLFIDYKVERAVAFQAHWFTVLHHVVEEEKLQRLGLDVFAFVIQHDELDPPAANQFP